MSTARLLMPARDGHVPIYAVEGLPKKYDAELFPRTLAVPHDALVLFVDPKRPRPPADVHARLCALAERALACADGLEALRAVDVAECVGAEEDGDARVLRAIRPCYAVGGTGKECIAPVPVLVCETERALFLENDNRRLLATEGRIRALLGEGACEGACVRFADFTGFDVAPASAKWQYKEPRKDATGVVIHAFEWRNSKLFDDSLMRFDTVGRPRGEDGQASAEHEVRMQRAATALSRYIGRYHSNVAMVQPSGCARRRGKWCEENVLAVWVQYKGFVPLHEWLLPAAAYFEGHLYGVDVRESDRWGAFEPSNKAWPVVPGCAGMPIATTKAHYGAFAALRPGCLVGSKSFEGWSTAGPGVRPSLALLNGGGRGAQEPVEARATVLSGATCEKMRAWSDAMYAVTCSADYLAPLPFDERESDRRTVHVGHLLEAVRESVPIRWSHDEPSELYFIDAAIVRIARSAEPRPGRPNPPARWEHVEEFRRKACRYWHNPFIPSCNRLPRLCASLPVRPLSEAMPADTFFRFGGTSGVMLAGFFPSVLARTSLMLEGELRRGLKDDLRVRVLPRYEEGYEGEGEKWASRLLAVRSLLEVEIATCPVVLPGLSNECESQPVHFDGDSGGAVFDAEGRVVALVLGSGLIDRRAAFAVPMCAVERALGVEVCHNCRGEGGDERSCNVL